MIDHTGIGVADEMPNKVGTDRVAKIIRCSGSIGFTRGVKQHTAFRAASNADVDMQRGLALAAWITVPGLRAGNGYPPGYYAAFLIDPDGNNIEVVCRS